MKSLTEKLSLLRWGAHYEGWAFTIFRMIVKASRYVGTRGSRSEWFQQLTERQFDKRFNVATSGYMLPDDMEIPEDCVEHAVEYAPTSANRFGWLLSQLPVDLSEYVFVDFGSGKGRVLLMASEFPFQHVLGIELSPELHIIAEQNIGSFRSHHQQCNMVNSINQDATQFEFPEKPLILYFFNPFSADILRIVIDNLQASLDQQPRAVIALYYNPLHAEAFEDSPTFTAHNFDFNPGPGWRIFTTEISN